MSEKARTVHKDKKRSQNHEKAIGMWIKYTPEHESSSPQQSDKCWIGGKMHNPDPTTMRKSTGDQSSTRILLEIRFLLRCFIIHQSPQSKPPSFLHLHLIPTLHLQLVRIIPLIQQEQKYPLEIEVQISPNGMIQ
jgi:hypothetical protein